MVSSRDYRGSVGTPVVYTGESAGSLQAFGIGEILGRLLVEQRHNFLPCSGRPCFMLANDLPVSFIPGIQYMLH